MKQIAETVIRILGGHRVVADVLNLDVSRVYRFTYPKERGGTDGIIPAEHQQTLMDYAIREGKPLTTSHFFEFHSSRNKRKTAGKSTVNSAG